MASENESQNELITMALESVSSDENVNLVLEGKLMDALIVKASVFVETRSGILLFLFSIEKGELIEIYSIFGNSPLINRIRTFENYSQFLIDLIETVKGGGIEKALSDRIGRALYKGINPTNLLSLFPKMGKKNYNDFCMMMQEIMNNELKIQSTKMQIDIEKVNSLKFRINNPLAEIYKPIQNPYKEVKKEPTKVVVPILENSPEKIKAEAMINDVQKNYKQVLMCKTIVSPVAGIDFDSLKENMKLLFVLPFETPEEKALAKSVGAVSKEGTIKPIAGEFLKIITGGKNEFHIFAKGPNGILLRAFEERPVKLALSKKNQQVAKKEERSELGKMMSVVVGILFVLIIILSFMYLA
ncbi:MAG TPA: hypothetical protein PK079_07010 [Leptospiraceae bacterium]|nr:hypothetical protein [Leptospiraceae bacterium]HMW05975.1 hypothetical protein [Leptospiraceae bacterium]HMX32093.1 hypothetical protein [Leptospiraceae bacterium]HMY32329.1 hypothetical protein [Leptospiraceae bacterium]HMZ62469.1 hypothetical protein [Leptospiraceae bacterium]